MTISKDLFLAILSLDSYSRDGEGVDNGLGTSSNDAIGNATFFKDRGDQTAKNTGFYAVSYTVSAGVTDLTAGTTVISYRGTDNFGKYYDGDRGANDILNGWLGGAGQKTSQTSLALDFYKSVTGKSVFEGAAANTIVTGHSLDGGLAGLDLQGHYQRAMGFGTDHFAGHLPANASVYFSGFTA
jgi:hypothetical protein